MLLKCLSLRLESSARAGLSEEKMTSLFFESMGAVLATAPSQAPRKLD